MEKQLRFERKTVLARERVIEFEKELSLRLTNMPDIEKDILSVGFMRSRWLTSVSKMDEVETDTFNIRVDIIKTKADLAALTIALDKTRLEGFYETQTLNYLISATKPQEEGESLEQRQVDLSAIARENLESLRLALKKSVDFRSKIAKQTHFFGLELTKHKIEHDSRHHSVVEELQERITQYAERMKDAVVTTNKQHQHITGEYLVLRHNARVANQILVRSQNEAALARQALQAKLDQLVTEATIQRERMEAASVAELKIMTDDVRAEVIKKEEEVNDVRLKIGHLKLTRRRSAQQLRMALRKSEVSYDQLQEKRRLDFRGIGDELRMLREMIYKAEQQLEGSSDTNVFRFVDAKRTRQSDEDFLTMLHAKIDHLLQSQQQQQQQEVSMPSSAKAKRR